MQDIDFFEGQRPLTKIVFILNNGKTTLTCTPWEEWRLIEPCPFTLRCGNKREEKLTQRFGLEHTQRSSFESTIGGTLGERGIAALESSLKSTLGEEIKFQIGTEVQQTFLFDSPACGYKLVKLYQRVRALHIKYDDQRFWHRNAVELTLVQWLKSIYDSTVVERLDPNCNCEKSTGIPDWTGIAARVECKGVAKLAVQRTDNHQLEFPEKAESLNSYFTWEGAVKGQIPTDVLPDYLRFLAGIDSGLLMDAVAWQEPVLFVTRPEFSHGTSEVTIELDESFEPIEAPFSLQPVGMSSESQGEIVESEANQVQVHS